MAIKESEGSRRLSIAKVGQTAKTCSDLVAVEEPLEIIVEALDGDVYMRHPLALTMRTPGHDTLLAQGFLLTEGLLRRADDIQAVERPKGDAQAEACNRILVRLRAGVAFDPKAFTRHVFTSSSCGVCGKITIDRLMQNHPRLPQTAVAPKSEWLQTLPAQLDQRQTLFRDTGGLHAAALFQINGPLMALYEDVGRHNALDKLIGHQLQTSALPCDNTLLLLSGRASFELLQKAWIAGIPAVAAIGAPSSLAVEVAQRAEIQLFGFLKDKSYNQYT